MIEFELIDETQNIEFNLEDNSQDIEFNLTDYDDSEVRGLIEDVDTKADALETSKADKTQVNSLSSQVSANTIQISQNKADISTLNDKVDNIHIPSKLSELVNDTGFITKSVNDLINYYKKNETYTKQEVNNLIGQISTISMLVVDELPTIGESNIIYLVPSENPKTQNEKDEFIWVNNKWEQIGSTAIDLSDYVTNDEFNDALDEISREFATNEYVEQVEQSIPSQLSQLTEDTTHRVVTDTEKTTWSSKADEGFTGIIDGTSANPTDGATLLNGVYKADESKTTSYISLPMEDGTTKKQNVQKGGIVIRTAARLVVLATQNLMYQYDMAQHFFYPAEPFVESTLRREFVDGIADLGTVSPPNTYYLTLPISYLAATVNTGDAGHTRITFTVADEIAEGDFELHLTDTEGNELIYADGATPKPVTGETWIFEIYGNTCEAICFKTTDGKSREDLLKAFMRRNSDQIYYPSLDGKPNFSIQKAAGNNDDPDRNVVITPSDVTLTDYKGLSYYGIDDTKIPLDLSLYDVSQQANQLHPYTQLPDGVYTVTKQGRLRLDAGDIQVYTAKPGEIIYKNNTELIIIGYYASTYFTWNSTDEVYEGGYFTTTSDVEYMLEDYEKRYSITNSPLVQGTITVNDGKWYRRTKDVNSLTLSIANLTEVPDTFKARVTIQTSATFNSFTISQRTAFKVYFTGFDCENRILKGKPNAYYDIEYKANGRGDIIAIVNGYDIPTS